MKEPNSVSCRRVRLLKAEANIRTGNETSEPSLLATNLFCYRIKNSLKETMLPQKPAGKKKYIGEEQTKSYAKRNYEILC